MVIQPTLLLKTLGFLWMLLAATMLVPLVYAVIAADDGMRPLAQSSGAIFLIGITLYLLNRRSASELHSRGAFLLVSASWVSATVIGAIPYYLSGYIDSPVDAWFEAASGFTTTGASILTDVEALPRSLLLWRSLTQFLGGMDLFRAEAPGPVSDKIGARVKETARALWIVYVVFAAAEAFLLWFFGMSVFDAVNHACTTMATGGYSTKNASIGHFQNQTIEWIVAAFMFLAGINFILHYRFLRRNDLSVFRDPELRFYVFMVLMGTLCVTFSIWGREDYRSFLQSLRYAAFQVVSIMSSTGYGTADYLLWGAFTQALLVLLMVIGGCQGSTGGGIKCVRAIVLVKQGYRELYRMVHPKAVLPMKLGTTSVPHHVIEAIFGFFFLYILLLGMTALVITAAGVDIVTAFSSVVSALSNIGPGLGQVGPMSNYSALPDLAKVLLSACMIVGRLEIMTVLILFTSEYWSS